MRPEVKTLARARQQDIEILSQPDKGAVFVRFTSGICAGTTGWILDDEIDFHEQVLGGMNDVGSPDLTGNTCRCSDKRDGFTLDQTLDMFVHAGCGHPTALALEKAMERESGLAW